MNQIQEFTEMQQRYEGKEINMLEYKADYYEKRKEVLRKQYDKNQLINKIIKSEIEQISLWEEIGIGIYDDEEPFKAEEFLDLALLYSLDSDAISALEEIRDSFDFEDVIEKYNKRIHGRLYYLHDRLNRFKKYIDDSGVEL